MYVCVYECLRVCMYACMYVCMFVCMLFLMYVRLSRRVKQSHGWDGRYVDTVTDMCPPRAMTDSIYRPSVALLSSIRARLAMAYASTSSTSIAGGGVTSSPSKVSLRMSFYRAHRVDIRRSTACPRH